MNYGDQKFGSESQDSGSPASVGPASGVFAFDKTPIVISMSPISSPMSPNVTPTSKGVENAKKRLRAFSIQKKTSITPLTGPKPMTSGNTTVIIGKLNNVKTTPKPVEVPTEGEVKKPPKPPKPGTTKRHIQDYMDQQKKTLAEIEDMKRKMELVELGIPLGLICPSSENDKAMPTKAMPPIKSLLDSSKVDQIILEAKKAKAEGKKFKFDYNKLLPDYDNPFQRKRDENEKDKKSSDRDYKDKDWKRSSKYDKDKKYSRRRDDKSKHRENRDKYYDEKKHRDKDKHVIQEKIHSTPKDSKETNVDLLDDYLVCDSWSIENEEKSNSSPKVEDTVRGKDTIEDKDNIKPKNIIQVKDIPMPEEKSIAEEKEETKEIENVKIEKLNPVIDSFEYEINPNEDEILDMFNEDNSVDKYAKTSTKKSELYDSPILKMFDDTSTSKDASDINEDKFLQSVINEIKDESIHEGFNPEKSLVEYDESPIKSSESQSDTRGSVTPELKSADSNHASDYSDGYKSTESGYKSTDSAYKLKESGYKSTESAFKSKESGYKSTESSNKSTERGHKSTESAYKLKENCYKSTESVYKLKESGYKSIESGYKSTDSSYKSNVNAEQYRISTDRDTEGDMSKSTVTSLETWSFVLKICQPLLFRHDKDKCFKETRTFPKLWYTDNPRRCNCVKDRSVVYEELEMLKMNLVDRVYGCDQIPDAPFPSARSWYPRSVNCLGENLSVKLTADDDWEADDSQTESKQIDRRSMTPQKNEEIYLDREYQKFMQALSEASEQKIENSRSTTPVATEAKVTGGEEKRKPKKRFSSEGWSQESDLEDDVSKSKKMKLDKERQRKRKHSTSTSSDSSSSEDNSKKKKKSNKKKDSKKSKASKRSRRLEKKYLKKLKEKQKKEKEKKRLMKLVENSDLENDEDKEIGRKDKKSKKKKQQKVKRSKQKKKKSKSKSSSSSESTSSSDSSTSDSELEKKSKKSKRDRESKKKDRKRSISETQSEELFDVNILKNIKTERTTDDEKQISPRKKPREIINVKELQNDFVGNNIHIKKEVEEKIIIESQKQTVEFKGNTQKENENSPLDADKTEESNIESESENVVKKNEEEKIMEMDLQRTSEMQKIELNESNMEGKIKVQMEETNQTTTHHGPIDESSQCSSQDSINNKEVYEKDESHLRPSSQNSNYNFTDVMASQSSYQKDMETEDKYNETYEQGNYEMYEQLAMAYQADVDNQIKGEDGERRIETVVRTRACGEIKCDWRAGDRPLSTHHRPSRWGLKPGEVNIVLTGGNNAAEEFHESTAEAEPQQVFKIQSLANRSDNCNISYDEAYMDTYGALDRLQYGDCFAENAQTKAADPRVVEQPPSTTDTKAATTISSLDERISKVLQDSVLSELTNEPEDNDDKDGPEKGILVTKPVPSVEILRANKRVSFADGYKPGQDSDVEEPPIKKKKRPRRVGCAWPCPASHADHVPLWDALPPPPPPPGSPPRHHVMPLPHTTKYDGMSLTNFMPPEPPPGILTF